MATEKLIERDASGAVARVIERQLDPAEDLWARVRALLSTPEMKAKPVLIVTVGLASHFGGAKHVSDYLESKLIADTELWAAAQWRSVSIEVTP